MPLNQMVRVWRTIRNSWPQMEENIFIKVGMVTKLDFGGMVVWIKPLSETFSKPNY